MDVICIAFFPLVFVWGEKRAMHCEINLVSD